MKDILGHKSWNKDEIIYFLDKGSFTMCRLPHYRYARVQQVCAELKSMGYIKKAGNTETSVNYIPTDLFKQWRESGTAIGYAKYHKALNPRKEKLKKCIGCGNKFSTLNYAQKWCGPTCKPKWKPKD